jgi:hypothetical protein
MPLSYGITCKPLDVACFLVYKRHKLIYNNAMLSLSEIKLKIAKIDNEVVALGIVLWSASSNGCNQVGHSNAIYAKEIHASGCILGDMSVEIPVISSSSCLLGLTVTVYPSANQNKLHSTLCRNTVLLFAGKRNVAEMKSQQYSWFDNRTGLFDKLLEKGSCQIKNFELTTPDNDFSENSNKLFSWDSSPLVVANIEMTLTLDPDGQSKYNSAIYNMPYDNETIKLVCNDEKLMKIVQSDIRKAYVEASHKCAFDSKNAKGLTEQELFDIADGYSKKSPEIAGVNSAVAVKVLISHTDRFPPELLTFFLEQAVCATGDSVQPRDDIIGIVSVACGRYATSFPYDSDKSFTKHGMKPCDSYSDLTSAVAISKALGWETTLVGGDCEDLCITAACMFEAIKQWKGDPKQFPLLFKATQATNGYVPGVVISTCSSANAIESSVSNTSTHCFMMILDETLIPEGSRYETDSIKTQRRVLLVEGTNNIVTTHWQAPNADGSVFQRNAHISSDSRRSDKAMSNIVNKLQDPNRLLISRIFEPNAFYGTLEQVSAFDWKNLTDTGGCKRSKNVIGQENNSR